jgi:hypothetical protein
MDKLKRIREEKKAVQERIGKTKEDNNIPSPRNKTKKMSVKEKLENLDLLSTSQLTSLTIYCTQQNSGWKHVSIIKKRINVDSKPPDSPTTKLEARMANREGERTYISDVLPCSTSKKLKWHEELVSFGECDGSVEMLDLINTDSEYEQLKLDKDGNRTESLDSASTDSSEREVKPVKAAKNILKPPKVGVLENVREDVVVSKFIYKE